MVKSQQVSWSQNGLLLESAFFPEAISCNMLKKLLMLYGRYDKWAIILRHTSFSWIWGEALFITCYLIKNIILLVSIRFHISSIT